MSRASTCPNHCRGTGWYADANGRLRPCSCWSALRARGAPDIHSEEIRFRGHALRSADGVRVCVGTGRQVTPEFILHAAIPDVWAAALRPMVDCLAMEAFDRASLTGAELILGDALAPHGDPDPLLEVFLSALKAAETEPSPAR